jgi:hypothetical protein
MNIRRRNFQIWKNNFQAIFILKVTRSLSGGISMARLQKGEREDREKLLHRLLRRLRFGVRESEVAEELGWQRRTANNYLRKLKDEDKAEREGRSWFAK